MYRQWELIADGEAMTLNSTYSKDMLQRTGSLSALLVMVSGGQASGFAQGGGTWRIIDYLTNIEVRLNGNPVGLAGRARELQAMAGYRLGQLPVSNWRNYSTNTQRDTIPILFGTSLWDKRRYLDLGRYNAVQVRITNTATSSQFSQLSVTIYGLWLREHNVPTQGYIRRELFREYAPSAGSTEAIYLPTEAPIAGIYLQGDPGLDSNGRVNTHPHNLLFDVRLAIRSRQVDLYRDAISELTWHNNYLWGYLPFTGGISYINAGREHDVGLAQVQQMAGIAGEKTGAAATVIPTVEGDENNPTQLFRGFQADVLQEWIARGLVYHNLWPLYMDKTEDLSEMLNPQQDGEITVDVLTRSTATVTSAQNRLYLERLVPV